MCSMATARDRVRPIDRPWSLRDYPGCLALARKKWGILQVQQQLTRPGFGINQGPWPGPSRITVLNLASISRLILCRSVARAISQKSEHLAKLPRRDGEPYFRGSPGGYKRTRPTCRTNGMNIPNCKLFFSLVIAVGKGKKL